MRRRKANSGEKAQVFLEYVIIISIVILVITAMSTMIKRGAQGMIKVVSDEIGLQEDSEQNRDEGYLIYSDLGTRADASKRTVEFIGNTEYHYDDRTTSASSAFINLGFSPDN